MSTPPQPQTYGVRIEAHPGYVTIHLDGQRLPEEQVTGYTLSHDVHGTLPTLVVHTRQPSTVEWEGLARVAVAEPADPRQQIVEFLAAVDPLELDRAVMARTDLGGGKGAVAVAMLATLTDWARGAA
ncbi:hypothetical protein ACFV3R_25360 [Streptomyces sp. NPDC059740]|uniref:hypothetical protein n=1 Tax=Streptomyces sp. NPDC059740 TaxID=3346926 RepID=UPI003649C756